MYGSTSFKCISNGQTDRPSYPAVPNKRETIYVSAAELAGVPIRVLREKVGSLKDKRHAIVSTLDFLFTGF